MFLPYWFLYDFRRNQSRTLLHSVLLFPEWFCSVEMRKLAAYKWNRIKSHQNEPLQICLPNGCRWFSCCAVCVCVIVCEQFVLGLWACLHMYIMQTDLQLAARTKRNVYKANKWCAYGIKTCIQKGEGEKTPVHCMECCVWSVWKMNYSVVSIHFPSVSESHEYEENLTTILFSHSQSSHK